jgi:hypothetical protein
MAEPSGTCGSGAMKTLCTDLAFEWFEKLEHPKSAPLKSTHANCVVLF